MYSLVMVHRVGPFGMQTATRTTAPYSVQVETRVCGDSTTDAGYIRQDDYYAVLSRLTAVEMDVTLYVLSYIAWCYTRVSWYLFAVVQGNSCSRGER